MLQIASGNREEGQVVELKKTKYLPYLFNLVMPKSFYHSHNRIVVARLYSNVHKHDKQAAEFFEGFQTPCFEVPASMFPGEAPLNKIVFMPPVMLPMGFEAGGVFGPGVLPRRSYPIDLTASGHKGQSPPLFVGLRRLYVQLPSEIESFLDKMGEFPATQDTLVYGMRRSNQLLKEEQAQELMLRNDLSLSMAYNLPAPPTPPSPYPYRHVPVQYNIYTPDLSNVLMMMPHQRKLTVAILSTVNNPHVPSVALATMGDEECPKFELPSDVFPICEGVNRPIFLPRRFLPKGFESGCVFKPGSLSELWFMGYMGRFSPPQPQHNCAITPPLFVGKISRVVLAFDLMKNIQMEYGAAQSSAQSEGSLNAVEPKKPNVPITKGFLVMETEHPTPPSGGYSLQSYQEGSAKGCVVKVEKGETQEMDEAHPTKEESKSEEEGEVQSGSQEEKYLSWFKVDSDIDLIAETMVDMGTAQMSLIDEEALPGVDGACVLNQLREVFEDRNEIRQNIDQLIHDHIYRMNRDRMLALRLPIRTCFRCGLLPCRHF
uniref:DM7 family protein GG19680 n=1 Tax=Drosophila erecta TaxID=7220 RepID=DM7A_DROER|nr:RecName: Full=DM7 family protein GG19680 [Drosophila erecta]